MKSGELHDHDDAGSLLDLTVRELLDAVAARTTAPGGGAAAALATALAAALAGMAARFTDTAAAAAAAEQADALRARAEPLADADAAAYGEFMTALRLPRDNPTRADRVARSRNGAAGVPAEIAEVANAVSELAAGLARDGNPNLRGDAIAATLLAAAAAGTAAELVAANAVGTQSDPRLERAREVAVATRQRAIEVS